ncbi:RNA polymerase sigma factor [Gilvimarinus algae]|uniref:Sigma-70 family RNA polymerase sigma factor n=1 Tax=Gilvimarinus algae TaxID=3058037 RepID=A0ABT8TII1_9GAMM|nr:sigma-70 family RNA polymerase sigma factor [Gilvimarinus sp. SDUM040014]MDO3383912.1 sigma-70 family RNA polymerase sigma factor [Gilvimarinus sp. SDUM040014]
MTDTDNTDTEEAALIEAALAGDDQAYIRLIERHYSVMLTVATGIAGSSLAEEVVQEAWVSAHRALSKFEGRASLKTWLLRIVSNEAKNRAKRESRQQSLDALPGETDGLEGMKFRADGHWANAPAHWHLDSPEALLEQTQLHRCINKTLALLPPAQKAAFVLRDLEQRSFEEICQLLDISSANARVLVHRARLSLMQVIDRYQETGQC